MGTDYSIVVPAYNEAELLPATLMAINHAMAANPLRGELIVCDNNSTDATTAIAQEHGATTVFEGYNQISRARNAGAKIAQGRYLIFVDADTLISTSLLQNALDNLSTGRCVGGGCVVSFEKNYGTAVKIVLAIWNWLSISLRLAAGSFFYCPRSDFEAVGGFSEAVYASEEIWLSRKLRMLGRKSNRKFCIIRHHPVVASGRKLTLFSTSQQVLLLLLMLLFPFFVRYRRLCGFWYKRDGAA